MTIVKADAKACLLELQSLTQTTTNPHRHIHIAIAPTKNTNKMAFFVEKAVEMGIGGIRFFFSKNTERKQLSLDRLTRVSMAALKQSGNLFLPEIKSYLSLKDCLKDAREGNKLIAYMLANPADRLVDFLPTRQKTVVFIGPEGGFSAEEITLAEQQGFTSISLGQARLRTETAGIVVCCLLGYLAH